MARSHYNSHAYYPACPDILHVHQEEKELEAEARPHYQRVTQQ